LQIFVDMFGGKWESTPANPKSDRFWLHEVDTTILMLAHKRGSSIYGLIGAAEGSRAGVMALGDYPNDMAAVEALQAWVNYLDGGGTLEAWRAHYPLAAK
jgi:hypothetical protein